MKHHEASEHLRRGGEVCPERRLSVLDAPSPRPRIVLIEDNTDSRELLRTILEMEGYEVHGADDGAEGLDVIVELQPDIALVDVGLPGLDGYEVARRARKDAPRTRLIALTGYGQPDDHSRSDAAGFHAHVVKPVDPTRLLRLLAEPSAHSS